MSLNGFNYDMERASAPVNAGTLWDILIDQDQMILTLLQIVLSIKEGNDEEFSKYVKEFMKRNTELEKLRDKLVSGEGQ